jgi:uncharacterized protein (TIGR00288 family)
MNSRHPRPPRAPVAPIHRGPQAISAASGSVHTHAPNAALLIDFDNVTMGIRSDLGNELRNLLSSDIIKGKVAVQRAYADWRRYPQYIVPLAESSIDMIMAPAYGSSKKNATDIRLAVDAMELVFTRPEIGTYILLSGDSDFASLVTKLKEYGKYVIGVGIRESSSDLLVMNCDEYYSYNALAGLVKSGEEEVVKHDPWELVVEGVERMKRNGDVMRSDRLKQVMQEIDSTFDEKDLGMAKFSRFCQEAAQRGLIKVTRLENGQMEVDVAEPAAAPKPEARAQAHAAPAVEAERAPAAEESGRRARRGRGRGRERERRPAAAPAASTPRQDEAAPAVEAPAKRPAGLAAEMTGERLTRDEALDLVRRAVSELTNGENVAVPAAEVRRKARELLGRDSESLSERFFHRILSDADAAHVVQLRKRGESYEVAPAAEVEVADQVDVAATQAPEASQAARSAAGAASLRRGIRSRGGRPGGRPAQVPPELLSLGVVESPAAAVQPSSAAADAADAADAAASVAPTTSEKEAAGAKAPATRKRTKRAATKKATTTTARKATKKVAKTAARSTSRGRKAAASSAGEAGESAPTSEASPRAAASPSPRASTTSSGDGAGAEAKSAGDAGAATKSRRKRGARKKSAPSSSATVAAEGGEGSQA